ncbi:structural maintenance of chromosomes protein 2-like [Varanus komodoensis]|uniref:structural maintenance of chromosomes protein 2-like n=1 Tax=Varanus komodoensis TaxID=61221 RepID=UPI001CF7D03E|nr:structural maintenance of chromosomes protein 2-like [Varanus komodoensis]
MDVALGPGNTLKQGGPGNFEEENVWLQEWIHEELAQGEIWQKQYEALLGHQAQLCSLLQAKSLTALEKKTQTLQEELEETQEALREFQNRSRQRQLNINKQEKENKRMTETVKDLERKVFKQQLEEKSNKDILKELRTEGNELKRHLSEWEAKWQTKHDRIKQKQHRIEKLSSTIQQLSQRSQELHRNITLLEDSVTEVQHEEALFQKEVLSRQEESRSGGVLWEERACDQMKRLPCLEPGRIDSKDKLLTISPPLPTLQAAWNLLWASAKVLLVTLLLALVFRFLLGWLSSQPCPQLHSAPLLYIQPKRLLPPFSS